MRLLAILADVTLIIIGAVIISRLNEIISLLHVIKSVLMYPR